MTAEESLVLWRRSIVTHLRTHHPGLVNQMLARLRRRWEPEAEVFAMFAGLGAGVTVDQLRAFVEQARIEERL